MIKKVNYKLKSLRVEQNMTQEDISKILGIHEATYNRKEQGLNRFSLDEAKVISDLFSLPIEDIFFKTTVQLKWTNLIV